MCFILSSARLRSPSPYWVISFIRTAISPKACTSSSARAAYRFKEIRANSKAPCVGVRTRPLVVVPIPIATAEAAAQNGSARGWLGSSAWLRSSSPLHRLRLRNRGARLTFGARIRARRRSRFPSPRFMVNALGELSLIFSGSPFEVRATREFAPPFLLLLLLFGNVFLQRDIS